MNQKTQKVFQLFQTTDGPTDKELVERTRIGNVLAPDLDTVVSACNSTNNPAYAGTGARDITYGDIIHDTDENKCFMVTPDGCIEVPNHIINYKDLSKMLRVPSQKLLEYKPA